MTDIDDAFKEELGRLLDGVEGWTQENKELAAEIAQDYAMLMIEIAGGHPDAPAELEQVKAQVRNLASAAQQTGVSLFNQAIERALKLLAETLKIAI